MEKQHALQILYKLYSSARVQKSATEHRDIDRAPAHSRQVTSYGDVFVGEYALDDVDGGPDGVAGAAVGRRVFVDDQRKPNPPASSACRAALLRQTQTVFRASINGRQRQQRFTQSADRTCA